MGSVCLQWCIMATKMQIFVKAIDGDTLKIETETATVYDVKQKVENINGIPVQLQRLIFEGKELEDGGELAYYKVGEKATLHLTMNLDGGHITSDLFRLANYHVLFKKICRKCYGQLSPHATRCRKAKCGRTTNIRYKKSLWTIHPFKYWGMRL